MKKIVIIVVIVFILINTGCNGNISEPKMFDSIEDAIKYSGGEDAEIIDFTILNDIVLVSFLHYSDPAIIRLQLIGDMYNIVDGYASYTNFHVTDEHNVWTLSICAIDDYHHAVILADRDMEIIYNGQILEGIKCSNINNATGFRIDNFDGIVSFQIGGEQFNIEIHT